MVLSPMTKIGAAVMLALAILAGVMRMQRDHARAALADYRREVAEATARAERKAREAETMLRDQADQLRSQLTQETKNANDAQDRLVAGIRSGAQRLSVAAHCPAAGQASSDSAAATGAGNPARAELDPQAAEDLVAIAADGDAAIRERNACIQAYERVRSVLSSP